MKYIHNILAINIDITQIGYFSLQHIIALIILFTAIGVMLFITNKYFPSSTNLQLKILCVTTWIAEITKILIYYFRGNFSLKTVLPLYFCSMFLYSSLIAVISKNPTIKLIGNAGLMSGTVGGFFGIFFSPSLKYYSVIHFFGLHTLIYHAVMIYCGILILMNNYYIPKLKDIFYSSVIILILTIAALIANRLFNANYMYINIPLKGAPTYLVVKLFGETVYPVLVVLAQIIMPFLLMYAFYMLMSKIKTKQTTAVSDAVSD